MSVGRYAAAAACCPTISLVALLFACLPVLLVHGQPNSFFSNRNEVTSDLIELEP